MPITTVYIDSELVISSECGEGTVVAIYLPLVESAPAGGLTVVAVEAADAEQRLQAVQTRHGNIH